MIDQRNTSWVEWSEKIRAIAQNGLTYVTDPFDVERYQQLRNISHEMIAQLADAPLARVKDYFLPDHGHSTPKIDIRGGVFMDNKILLVRERSDGHWALPGGWCDIGETPAHGVEREIMEESGYTTKAAKLIALRDTQLYPYTPKSPYHIYKIIFLCEMVGGSPQENIEVSEIDFFAVDNLPQLSQRRTIIEDIRLLFEHHNNTSLPAIFD